MVLITALVIKPATTQTIDEKMNIVQRLNYGVIFRQESFLHMSTESWLHTFKVELPKKVTLSKMYFCEEIKNECNSMNNMVNFIHALHDSTESQLKETIKAIHALVPQTNYFGSKRNQRSLLPFIGSLAKGIFGLATLGDVQMLAKHINELNRRSILMANTLHQHGSHLSSFMSIINNRTTNLWRAYDKTQYKSNKLLIHFITHFLLFSILCLICHKS